MMAEGAEACYMAFVGYTNLMWEAAQKASDETSKEIIMVSSQNFCPVDTGALKESADDKVAKNSRTAYTHELSYETDYAWWVHELPYQHYNPPMAQWKYLETPLYLYSEKFREKVASEVGGVLD
jgi:hypothetical protein